MLTGPDFSLYERFKPDPPTDEEARAGSGIPLVDYEILINRMQLMAVEGKEVMIQTGSSLPLVAEDMNAGIYTAAGDMALSAAGVYFHSVTGQLPIKFTVKHWSEEPSVGVSDGDVFYSTDPIYGGTHTPDQLAFLPVFYDGELVAWTGAVAHQSDIGAPHIGLPAGAQSAFEDGMRLPPFKIGTNFTIHEDLLHALAEMTRVPHSMKIDVKARVATCMRLRQRILELCEEFGASVVKGLLRRMIWEETQAVQRKLESYNDGIFRATTFFDDTGLELGLLRVSAELEKRGGNVTVRVDASPETPGAYNGFTPLTMAAIANPLFKYLLSDVPPSIGVMDAFEFEVPDGSMFAATPWAATNSGLMITFCLEQMFTICFAKMAFGHDQDSIAAPQDPTTFGAFYAGMDRWGRPYALLDTTCNGNGSGARTNRDGLDVMAPPWALYADTLDAETIEGSGQVMFLYRRFSRDSHGFGMYRGGASPDTAIAAYDAYGGEAAVIGGTLGFANKFLQPSGLFGGYGGSCFPGVTLRHSSVIDAMEKQQDVPMSGREFLEYAKQDGELGGWFEVTKSQQDAIQLADGDVVFRMGGGGGGYGDVLERDPALVVEDVSRDMLSIEAAERVYGVILNQDLRIDWSRTEQLRDQIREARRTHSVTFSEFEAEWQSLQPPQEALKHYGSWPR